MQSKINICFVLSHIPQGGYERQLLNLFSNIDYTKFKITLLLYLNDKIFYEKFTNLPIKIVSRKAVKNKYINWIIGIGFLHKNLRKNKYDIIQTGLFHNGFVLRFFVPLKFRRNLIYNIRNNLKDFSKIQIIFERLLLKNTKVTCNSIESMNQFNKQIKSGFSAPAINIYNGIQIETSLKKVSNIISDRIFIGAVGRVAVQKNQIQILRAINNLRCEFNFIFNLIGSSGDNSKQVNNYIERKNLKEIVHIIEPVNNINYYYKKFNIFILSSLYEGCPNVLFEAMLHDCICIISSGANSDNFIKDGINGYVYDGSDYMLSQKIKLAVNLIKKKNHLTMIDSAKKFVKYNFSIKKMVENYTKLYKNLSK